MHAYLYNIQKGNTQLQSYRVVCNFKGSVWDNRLWNTSMHEAAGAIKQRQISSWVWAGESCHLSELHLQSAAILSAPLPAPLHLWKYIFHQDGSPKSPYMVRKMLPAWGLQPLTRLCVTPLIWTKSLLQLFEQDCELWTEPCWMAALLWALWQYFAHSPPPPFVLFPCSHLLIRFSASAEWVKRNYHTYVRGKGNGGVQNDKRKKELHHRDIERLHVCSNKLCGFI